MGLYELPTESGDRSGFWRKHGLWLIPLLIFDGLFLFWWLNRTDLPADTTEPVAVMSEPAPMPEPEPEGIILSFPTPRENPLSTEPDVLFMPTAAGRIESAHYGSVRTVKLGNGYYPSFHEGIDIAPVERDRKNHPVDPVSAAADGTVLYINRVSGNSNYGKYVVLGHDDPLGEIFTLYAHLADVEAGISPGQKIERGSVIGKMGHTASTGIPLVRAHLHFEIGVLINSRFYTWFKKQKLKPDHKNFHGYNLSGINPLDALEWQEEYGRFSMKDYLARIAPAFSMLIKADQIPDYFIRYPALWQGDPTMNGALVLSVSEGGVLLSGRPATAAELHLLGRGQYKVLTVDTNVLDRNGLRIIVRKNDEWVLGKNGKRWLEILAYH